MPSPFPGMDPWVEHPSVFPDFHHAFIVHLSAAINAAAPLPYYSRIAGRTWQELFEVSVPSKKSRDALDLIDEREIFLQVFQKQRNEVPVTVLQLLSALDKHGASVGRNVYLAHQREVLDRRIHLVEIDLLRDGLHTTAAPESVTGRSDTDYHVSVYGADGNSSVYAWRLEQRLPIIEMPLLASDEPIRVDLQSVADQCYDGGRYERQIPYRARKPHPPLTDAQREWADHMLTEKGL